MRWLQGADQQTHKSQQLLSVAEGVAGASAFRADAALVVTWYNTAPAVSGRSDLDSGLVSEHCHPQQRFYYLQLSTYQVVWLTDQPGRLSYVILNYDKVGRISSFSSGEDADHPKQKYTHDLLYTI